MGPIKLDLFAERLNAQVCHYVSWKPDPMGVATDALMIKWTDRQAYAFPPFCLIPRSLAKVEREGGANNCNSIMADSSFLSSSTEHDGERFNSLAPSRQFTIVTRGEDTPTNSEQDIKISGVKIFKRSKQVQGILGDATRLLAAAWRKGTQSAYNSCWRHWCTEKQIDPFCTSVEQTANFLTYLFEKGYEYRTINSYRSAISSFHPAHKGVKVRQTVLIKQPMMGVFNSRPPVPRYTETWDVDLVLKYIMNLPEDKDLTLKQLSQKLTMLMSLTSAGRSSEICKLDTKFMNV